MMDPICPASGLGGRQITSRPGRRGYQLPSTSVRFLRARGGGFFLVHSDGSLLNVTSPHIACIPPSLRLRLRLIRTLHLLFSCLRIHSKILRKLISSFLDRGLVVSTHRLLLLLVVFEFRVEMNGRLFTLFVFQQRV